MHELNIEYIALEWSILIDSSKYSLKAVLLHNGNKLPYFLLAPSVTMKGTYEDLDLFILYLKISTSVGYTKGFGSDRYTGGTSRQFYQVLLFLPIEQQDK